MTLLRFLALAPIRVMALIAATGVASGLASAAILAIVNRALYESGAGMRGALVAMLALIAFKIATNAVSRWLLIQSAQETLLKLSVDLCRRVLSAPLRLIEDTGPHRILTALTSDVPALGSTLQALPSLSVNAAVILGCAAYLGWLYPIGLLTLLGAVAVGSAVYFALHASAMAAISRARQRRDELMKSYRELSEGIKELKMNSGRREEFMLARLDAVAQRLKGDTLAAMRKYIQLDAWSQALFYVMLAGVLFFFPRDRADASEILTGYAFAALYMMNPVWAIIGALPTLAAGATALRKLDEVGLAFGEAEPALAAPARAPVDQVDRIELAGVTFAYDVDSGEFTLGPLDLVLHRGEIVFLVGGNGSGKTTLLKLLTGLYRPASGEISLNGERVTDATADWYRQHFAAVFFDFHLFEQLFGAMDEDVDRLAPQYLRQLELDHKIAIAERRFSTTQVSQGQRKRLALLTALIEERPVCVFDEWAADQDPRYKEIFYSQILPMLKALGKIVFVVTHDDRYFHCADRVIKLDEGQTFAEEPRRIMAT